MGVHTLRKSSPTIVPRATKTVDYNPPAQSLIPARPSAKVFCTVKGLAFLNLLDFQDGLDAGGTAGSRALCADSEKLRHA